MGLKVKLIALLLVISLVPLSAGGYVATEAMSGLNEDAQQRSAERLEGALTDELNSSVDARSDELQTAFGERERDARSLAASATMRNYLAAGDGEMDAIKDASHQQVGYMALEMHNGIENARRSILISEYDGRDWEELSESEQAAVEDRVEELITGTDGSGVAPEGTMYDSFQPGYIGDTGYAYVTDRDSNIVAHHNLEDGVNLREDADLAVFADIEERIETDPALRNGSTYGIAEYRWEDTTQEGNPQELKFIAYTYYEPFDWVLAPSVYYYELQQTAVADAESQMAADFERYLETKTVTVAGEDRPAYRSVTFADAEGQPVVAAERSHEPDRPRGQPLRRRVVRARGRRRPRGGVRHPPGGDGGQPDRTRLDAGVPRRDVPGGGRPRVRLLAGDRAHQRRHRRGERVPLPARRGG